MKKSLLYDQAERLYTEEQWTYNAISAELDCSDRTLRNWAKQGRWDEKRAGYLSMRQNLTGDVKDIAQLLASKIKSQLNNEQEPAAHLMYAFTRMAASLLEIREYEKNIRADEEQAAGGEDDRLKTAAAKFKEVFGVDIDL